ncbi:protein Gemin2 [Eupeodes corollae]|uniref:protein Gemin2 n=1 Tax=Eupeodes corollae TaxID=290404 RepID=UPI002490C8E0|nr:protein Gemin2 [Eupeodes corollae]
MDLESFQQQALQVRQPDEDFDPDSIPQNGEEFLMKVIYERKHCPAILVKPPKGKHSKPNTVTIPEINEMDTLSDVSPSSLRPTVQWKDAQAEDFIGIMNKVENMRKQPESNQASDITPLPLTDDENEWEAFCRKNTPLLSTILRIDQRLLEKLLEFESEWLSDDDGQDGADVDLCGKDQWLGAWIYSSLACLRMPLEPDVHSILRDIAKTCIRLRNKLGPEDVEKAVPYNLFILIICKVFAQLDLAEFI